MIDRYTTASMKPIFSLQSRYQAFLDVECASLYAFSKEGIIPASVYETIRDKAQIDVSRIDAIEKIRHHDIIAFTQSITEQLGDEKKWFHYGLTSTDVVDTANAVRFKKANQLIEKKLATFIETLKHKAKHYKMTPIVGRTHGIHADITSLGLKFALYVDIFSRQLEQFKTARKAIEVGKISGAVGNHANVSPKIQDLTCEKLGIASAAISTQVLSRDRHAQYMSVLGIIGSSIEQLATEIRHLSRTEVGEVEEYFAKGQKGSSAMPHKKNPIASENMSGCARMLRGYMHMAYENINLWHERDISHSSVERVGMIDAIILTDYMLERFNKVIDVLQINEERMHENINQTQGVIFSQRVLHALIDKGLSREDAYDIVQKLAHQALENKQDFKTLLKKDKTITTILDEATIDGCFTLDHYFKAVDEIFERLEIK